KATLSDEMFDKGSKIRVFSVVFTCFNCGAGFDEQLNTCPQCNWEFQVCMVCKGELKPDSNTSNCPNCNSTAHEEHLIAWLSIKAQCPICKVDLTIS
ncbi:MAG: hypothetical protein ACXAD7_25815, partial [Candidatus Kariarchaeaceae archaeon]